jgi:prepilin-type N-terminal cleavage/methylation domain-containing protein
MRGFTLIELLVTIVIVSVVGVAALIPALVSVRGLGPRGGAAQARFALLAQGQAELFERELTALGADQWVPTSAALAAASPYQVSPDPQIDGKIFQVSRSVECLRQDLVARDSSCSSGYLRITVAVVDAVTSDSFALSFIKTQAAL